MQIKDNIDKRVHSLLKKIPSGKVTSYKEISRIVGIHPRTVGLVLKRNKNPNILCYRVIKDNGEIGGYNRGKEEKMRKLTKDGIKILNGKIDKKYIFRF